MEQGESINFRAMCLVSRGSGLLLLPGQGCCTLGHFFTIVGWHFDPNSSPLPPPLSLLKVLLLYTSSSVPVNVIFFVLLPAVLAPSLYLPSHCWVLLGLNPWLVLEAPVCVLSEHTYVCIQHASIHVYHIYRHIYLCSQDDWGSTRLSENRILSHVSQLQWLHIFGRIWREETSSFSKKSHLDPGACSTDAQAHPNGPFFASVGGGGAGGKRKGKDVCTKVLYAIFF